jgi:hypothetical protein
MVTNTPQGGMDMNNGDFKIFNNVLMKYLGKGGVVKIPDGIQEISHFAFQSEYCTNITEVIIPSSVKEVNFPFSHCSALERITVNEENPNYQTIDGNLYTKDGKTLVTYAPASKRIQFCIPEGVKTVETLAFANCSLEELVIPSSVNNIENAAFGGSIKRLIVEEGNVAYYMHNGLLLTQDNKTVLRYVGDATTEVPFGVTHIATGAFARTDLACITLPETVQIIGNGAFSDCDCLETIELSQGITSIEQYAFYGCKKLKTITLPASLRSIGRNTFEGCSSLTEIEIPQGITELEGQLFTGCSSLTSVTIPSSVANISSFAFADCSDVTIKGHKNSYAQTFAKEQGIPFVEV